MGEDVSVDGIILTLPVPFEAKKLTVPTQPTAWPSDKAHRISVNSFGIGGANAHVSYS